MATDLEKFFHSPQAAAVLKHGVLKRYLPVFAAKVGSRRGMVHYIDCYAGPGNYLDGTPGSPEIALETAIMIDGLKGNAALTGYFIEKDPGLYERLDQMLSSSNFDSNMHRYQGDAENQLPPVLDSVPAREPIFLFVDPFGLPVPFDLLTEVLGRSGGLGPWGRGDKSAAIEVLLNFSPVGLQRRCGQALSTTAVSPSQLKSRQTQSDNLNSVLGGDWWQEIWRGEATNRKEQIRDEYIDRLAKSTQPWGTYRVPVRDRFGGPSDYFLFLFTQHSHGFWFFNDAVSSASEEWREHVHAQEGMLELEPLPERESKWVDQIYNNLLALLSTQSQITINNFLPDIYSSTLGLAREKHLRKAIKQLHRDGKTSFDGKGKLLDAVITR